MKMENTVKMKQEKGSSSSSGEKTFKYSINAV